MSTAAKELLETFEKLEPEDRQEVAAEILRRAMGTGELPEETYSQVARGLFDMYEKEESGRGEN